MTRVVELSAVYANFMLGPQRGRGVCSGCFDLIGESRGCDRCAHFGGWVDAAAPISYSIAGGQLHHALAGYKRLYGDQARSLTAGLAAVLWRHLEGHEDCLARAAGVAGFDVVTTVPSSDRSRQDSHPLQRLVGELVGPVRPRYERLLRRTGAAVTPHQFTIHKYEAIRELEGRSVLLVDDTWTTGANAQGAAAALKRAGARTVAAVVIGRYVNRDHGQNHRQLRGLPPFDWGACAWCREPQTAMHRVERDADGR
jgi:predicted amidophosphoribosyltransferase